MTPEEIKNILKVNRIEISSESDLNNGTGTALRLANGVIVNCWKSGKTNYQGNNAYIPNIKALLETSTTPPPVRRKAFVVYGHDHNARTQLEAMLRRWDIEPLILDQIASAGQTIIEKLEETIDQADFGIVLATPDDIGYKQGDEENKRFRVRQNVILEMGMLLAKLGRNKVAILLSQSQNMESPSDISGLIYIPFTSNIEETKLSLAKEMNRHGYVIDLAKL